MRELTPTPSNAGLRAHDWRNALLVFGCVLAAYILTMVAFRHFGTSPVSYFNLLARSFIEGHTYLADPPATVDLAHYNNRWYVPFPPLPAVLMVPAVLLSGARDFNVGLFMAVVAALAASTVLLIIRGMANTGLTRLTRTDSLVLTAGFAFGTIAWYMSTTSNVWFVAQVSTYTCALLALLGAVRGWRPTIVGAALALAVTGRPHAVAIVPLLIAIARARDRSIGWPWFVAFLAPVACAGLSLAIYNMARFGNPGDFGYQYALIDDQLGKDFRTYGQFHVHFLPHNLYAMFLEAPQWNPRLHVWTPNPDGMSVFATMPFIVWMFRAHSDRTWLPRAAWASLILGLVPPLLYYSSGSIQFGPRFWLDVMPATLFLVILGVRDGLTPWFRAAVALSIVVNAAGVVWWHWPRAA